MAQIRSRILQYMPKELLVSLNDICYDVTIPDNNTKVDMMVSVLDKYDIDYIELGPGTNRFAILIDGYVFKIAMDRYGVKDNWAEFAIAKELQPYVTKTYECNGLVVVAEYVTVISKEEFIEKKDNIRTILSYLAQGYLMGDVGSISKNFMNWGYRDDGQLVILDFAYIYRIKGDEMICGGLNSDGEQCMEFLEYDENFNKLTCPKCRKTYTFYDIRKKIDSEYEKREVELSKQMAYQTTEANTPIGEQVVLKTEPITKSDIYGKDDEGMFDENVNEYNNEISTEDAEAMYSALLDKLPSVSVCNDTEDTEESVNEVPHININMADVLETAEEFAEDLDGDGPYQSSTHIVTSEYEMMKESIIGGVCHEEEYYSDPEEVEYVSESDEDRPSTISETVTDAINDELEEEFAEIEDKENVLVYSDCVNEDEPSSSITFIDEDSTDDCEVEDDVDADDDNSEECADDNAIEVDADAEETIDYCIEEPAPKEDLDEDTCDADDGYPEEYSEQQECDEDEEDCVKDDITIEEHTDEPVVRYTLEADINDEISEEDAVERDEAEAEQKSFIQFIEPDETPVDDIEAARRLLRSDIPTEDELDDMYDEAIEENQKYRYGKKRGRNE